MTDVANNLTVSIKLSNFNKIKFHTFASHYKCGAVKDQPPVSLSVIDTDTISRKTSKPRWTQAEDTERDSFM